MKLGKRLTQLNKMIPEGYEHIWDCCCDHGLLGMTLLKRYAAPNIHFVDIVPKLVETLELKLLKAFPEGSNNQPEWSVSCSDVSHLPLDKHEGKHLVIIAGVGGDEVINLVDKLHQRFPSFNIDYLLCPVYHQYAVRQHLIRLGFGLLDERLVKERRQFYEILHITSQACSGEKISPVGKRIWQGQTEAHIEIASAYLRRTLAHYKKAQRSLGDEVDKVIQAYERCAEQIRLIT